MDISVQLTVDDEPISLERTIRCDLYAAPTGIGFWDHSIHAFGTRLRHRGGVAIVTPHVCEYLATVAQVAKYDARAKRRGIPKSFVPAIILTDDMQAFSSLTLYLTRSILTAPHSRVHFVHIDGHPSAPGKRESHADEFGWLRLVPKGSRAFDHSVRPVAYYRGWQAVKFTEDMWRGHKPTEEALAKYTQPQFLAFRDQPRYGQWPNYPPAGYFPPETSAFLRGMPLPPCEGEIAWRFLCVKTNTFDTLVPVIRRGSSYALSEEAQGTLVLYKIAVRPGDRDPRTSARAFEREFALELDGIHPNPDAFQRLIFYRPMPATLIEMSLVGFSVYE